LEDHQPGLQRIFVYVAIVVISGTLSRYRAFLIGVTHQRRESLKESGRGTTVSEREVVCAARWWWRNFNWPWFCSLARVCWLKNFQDS